MQTWRDFRRASAPVNRPRSAPSDRERPRLPRRGTALGQARHLRSEGTRPCSVGAAAGGDKLFGHGLAPRVRQVGVGRVHLALQFVQFEQHGSRPLKQGTGQGFDGSGPVARRVHVRFDALFLVGDLGFARRSRVLERLGGRVEIGLGLFQLVVLARLIDGRRRGRQRRQGRFEGGDIRRLVRSCAPGPPGSGRWNRPVRASAR